MSNIADATIVALIIPVLTITILLCFLDAWIKGSKTRQYRKKLADMYVSGKIRQIATKDKIDINDELRQFILFTKHEKKFMQDLDDSIEMEMRSKIDEEIISNFNKEEKSSK